MIVRYDAGAGAYDQLTGRWSRLYADAALAAANAQVGAKLLDLATGTADSAIIGGCSVGLTGTVVGADLSVPMLHFGFEKDLSPNVFLVAADAMRLPFPDNTFQCAICLFGLMFFPDPVDSLCELRRVLAHDGRAALTTWERPERAPFAGLMAEELAAELPDHAAEILKPFSLADPAVICMHMQNAGFHDIRVDRLTRSGTFQSAEEYFDPYGRGGGRLGQFFLGLEPAARGRVKSRVRTRLALREHAGTIGMDIEALLVSGTA